MTQTDERTEFARALAEIVAAEMPLSRLREVSAETSFDRAFWDTFREAGFLSVMVPESLGGLGLSIQDATGIFYELGRNPVPGPVLDNVVAAPLIRAAAPDAGAFDEGTIVALVDPEATTWPRQDAISAGGGRLQGRVELVRSADSVGAFLVAATDESTTRVYLVPSDAPGVLVEPAHLLEFGARYAPVSFDVALADATELGVDAGETMDTVRTALRIAMAAEVAGAGRALLDLATAYSLDRKQFGQAIASFQAMQQMLAETFEFSNTLESLLDWCVVRLPAAERKEQSLVGMRAKAGASEFGRLIAENSLQVHGGIGFTAEHDVNIYYKLILAREAHYGDRRSLARMLGDSLLETSD